MFFFFDKFKEVKRTIKMRDEWGELHEITISGASPRLTDQELADQLKVGVTTVITHRRD